MLKVIVPVVALLLAATGAHASEISGVPHVVSGDAVTIGKSRIRLAAVAAPGLEQLCINAAGERWTCGLAARDELAKHVEGKSWTCQPQRTDRYGRSVAKCTMDGEDVAHWLVRSGWAIAVTRISHDYVPDETAAKGEKIGLWAGAFIAPPEWRRRNKQAPVLGGLDVNRASRATLLRGRSASTPPSPECAIKGHVNWSGTCIYHEPGGRWYARVKMEPDNGDRWFCSREEAELADCRETKR
ncbi:thermonuclease family protein [Bradyrhizobium sp. U87765 SZCCT0131]|uniref:thermonuclease family protein n=1 Tax=unclassified Bradyrhizobium TaxID=2631580 RepID=UPI001BAAC7B0|nr:MULTISPECIES: thermonuclease family protein [unclassified Bradyrhizobium]MBR1222033.1 thermonuclease family protein [Bradyrhizobium sp. U87765 SZCCT0131]MBR1263769.1 thermonuclease family protein [Bradyrhizobium sp. U87765 SZCCT0134]MBR1302661.1 thermonuclease family protein [Bradyrhizobium sp. U87765 SZCCT0110]MBR1320019.1 thermonuclease family protein [Bradyrhizobium sp. U87765 SZCCT0109]MBR1348868.1 thermonuclease family protein [Bradyrhizobium sp. U87765 SZCCT0048]